MSPVLGTLASLPVVVRRTAVGDTFFTCCVIFNSTTR